MESTKGKKSPQQRFLLIIGILFFMVYLVLGLIIIFWKDFPFAIENNYRIAFGVLLIVYSVFRFLRLINSANE
ncbi:MAG TPA: hypothetical protein VF581_00540 [Flavobacterium sp.]